jgi:hypothetical protein
LTKAHRISYTEVAVRLPPIARFGHVIGIALSLVCGPVVPPEHVHVAGIEGRTSSIVHSHTSDNAEAPFGRASLEPPHGDHSLAVYLTAVYDRVSRSMPQPVVPVLVINVTPQFQPIAMAHAHVVSSAHGPPRSTSVTRAPPRFS